MNQLKKEVLYCYNVTIEELKEEKKKELKEELKRRYINLRNIINDKHYVENNVQFRISAYATPLEYSYLQEHFIKKIEQLIETHNLHNILQTYNEFEQTTLKNYLKGIENTKKIKTGAGK